MRYSSRAGWVSVRDRGEEGRRLPIGKCSGTRAPHLRSATTATVNGNEERLGTLRRGHRTRVTSIRGHTRSRASVIIQWSFSEKETARNGPANGVDRSQGRAY